MATELDPISDLDPAEVAAARAILADRVAAAFPDADVRRGVYHDRVLHPAAALASLLTRRIDRELAAASLLDVEADPTLADDATVDRILSNFRVSRRGATVASGEVVFVVAVAAPITLPAGTALTAGPAALRTTSVVTVRTSPDQVAAATDRALTPLPGGGYAFAAPARAVEPGPAGALRRGAVVAPDLPPPNFVRAYVAEDWSGGLAAESTAELLAAMRAGLAAKAWGSRATIDSMLRDALPGLASTSSVGTGDPEMARAARGLFPVAAAARVDVWLRPHGRPALATVARSAVLVARDADGVGTWEAHLGADDAPGFLWVDSAGPPGGDPSAAGFEVVSTVRGVDPAAASPAPDVRTGAEAAYSRFQTAAVRFRDPTTPAGALQVGVDRRDCVLTLATRPLVAEAQALLSSRRLGPPAGDALARAAVPGRVSVEVEVLARPGSAGVDASAAAAAVADLVEGLGFGGRLTAAAVAAAVAPSLAPGAAVGEVLMRCDVPAPSGATIRLRGRARLDPPDAPADGATARTTAFTADPGDVTFRVATVPAPEG